MSSGQMRAGGASADNSVINNNNGDIQEEVGNTHNGYQVDNGLIEAY